MDSNSGDGVDDNGLGDSYLTGGQYMVDSGDADDTLGAGDNDDEARGDNEPLREQDRFLPIANVARIMKKSIPKSGKIAKDAKECVQECVSEFISFITSEVILVVFQSSKGEKGAVGSGGAGDGTLDEIPEEFSNALPANILTDQTGQQNVIFTHKLILVEDLCDIKELRESAIIQFRSGMFRVQMVWI
ncbi:hypothetical protein FSP39_007674 [Pinctada imbricata]|uniref:Transcription factor CBF/NF-Y/archaeal histone domain-containing protein n=1 Tax=Pinctada imbricata TaxID=66713 RepID=A0AA88YN12_PINIB|nr:hypothetical protein FSP39_007674 [Pinctada imbricata]